MNKPLSFYIYFFIILLFFISTAESANKNATNQSTNTIIHITQGLEKQYSNTLHDGYFNSNNLTGNTVKFALKKAANSLTTITQGYQYNANTNSLIYTLEGHDKNNIARSVVISVNELGHGALTIGYTHAPQQISAIYGIGAHRTLHPIIVNEPQDPCLQEALAGGNIDTLLECLTGSPPSDNSDSLSLPGFDNGSLSPDCSQNPMLNPSTGSTSKDYVHVAENNASSDAQLKSLLVEYTEVAQEAAQNIQDIVDYNNDIEMGVEIFDAVIYEKLMNTARQAWMRTQDAYNSLSDYINNTSGLADQLEPLPGENESQPDPRCEQRNTDSNRGTLFRNPDFCTSGDYLTCLAEEQDPVRRLTEGKCVTSPGPDGRQHLVCGGQSLVEAPSVKDGHDSPNCVDSEIPCWTDPNAPPVIQGRVNYEYIDVLDLGHVFIGLCAVDRCPSAPFLENNFSDKKLINQ